jgi:hypothetical protein
MRMNKLVPVFVEYIPLEIEEGFLYISMKYATATHLCACGCGERVVTPISKRAWSLSYNGEEVTLTPSIGNYEQECQSHYFIRNNRIDWCSKVSIRGHVKLRKNKKRKKRKKWYKFWD